VTPVFRFAAGDSPLLISVPHDGREVPAAIRDRMTAAGRSLPDTDWHVAELYAFAESLGANLLLANYSRYVVDLNRAADDRHLYPGQVATGLCPQLTFGGEAIYREGGVDDAEKAQRVEDYWRPYHTKIRSTLDTLRATYGYALLWDAHSIPSVVPRLFDGRLPVLNLGSNDSASCAAAIESAVNDVADRSAFSSVHNGRFKGGYITRHYGDPANGVHALQLEIAQRAYMDESQLTPDEHRMAVLRDTLQEMLATFLKAAERTARRLPGD